MLLISNQTDPELACKVMEEFNDIATATRLNLNTGELKFEFFRQCLGGAARSHWDVAVAAQAGQTNAEFKKGNFAVNRTMVLRMHQDPVEKPALWTMPKFSKNVRVLLFIYELSSFG